MNHVFKLTNELLMAKVLNELLMTKTINELLAIRSAIFIFANTAAKSLRFKCKPVGAIYENKRVDSRKSK